MLVERQDAPVGLCFVCEKSRKAQLMLWIRLSASASPGESAVSYDSLLRGCSQIYRGIIRVIRAASAGSHIKSLFPIKQAETQTLSPSLLRDKTSRFFTAISCDWNGRWGKRNTDSVTCLIGVHKLLKLLPAHCEIELLQVQVLLSPARTSRLYCGQQTTFTKNWVQFKSKNLVGIIMLTKS